MADLVFGILVATPDDLNADGGMMTAIRRVGNRNGGAGMPHLAENS